MVNLQLGPQHSLCIQKTSKRNQLLQDTRHPRFPIHSDGFVQKTPHWSTLDRAQSQPGGWVAVFVVVVVVIRHWCLRTCSLDGGRSTSAFSQLPLTASRQQFALAIARAIWGWARFSLSCSSSRFFGENRGGS